MVVEIGDGFKGVRERGLGGIGISTYNDNELRSFWIICV